MYTPKHRNRPRGRPRGTRITMEFSPDIYDIIRKTADEEEVSMTRLVNEIIREWAETEASQNG